MSLVHQNKSKAAALAVFSVAVASAQDAIVKSMSGAYPAYETVLIRCFTALPILLAVILVMRGTLSGFRTPLLPLVFLRGFILFSGYLGFILAIAAMPIATAVAIYFTMPFFVAMLAGRFLDEAVPLHRWIAIAAAFIGVLVMVRPFGSMGGDTDLIAALFALYSALAYAVGQMMGRSLSQKVDPLVMSQAQNIAYMVGSFVLLAAVALTDFHFTGNKSLAFLTRAFVWPTAYDLFIMGGMGALAAIAAMTFTFAYKYGEASFVAPFEYSAMIWAVTYGLIFFGDFPDTLTWIGMIIVVLAGIYMMWHDRKQRVLVTAPDSPPNP